MSTRKPEHPQPAADDGDDRWLAELLSRPGPPDAAQFSALQAELARPEPRRKRWPALLLLPLSALAIVAARAWLGDRSLWRIDLAFIGQRLSWGLAALALCAAVAIAVTQHRGRSGFGLPSGLLAIIAGALSCLIALTPLLLRGPIPQPALHLLGAPCAAVVLTTGALALTAIAWVYRHTQPVGARARALTLGAATAAWTGIVISLHCPGESLPHLLWGHTAPLLALVLLAAWQLPKRLQP